MIAVHLTPMVSLVVGCELSVFRSSSLGVMCWDGHFFSLFGLSKFPLVSVIGLRFNVPSPSGTDLS